MSVLSPSADMLIVGINVCYVPQADIAAVLLAQSMEYQRLAIPYLGAGEVYRQDSLVVVHRTIIGSCQRPADDYCLYRFEGRKRRENRDLHVTSTHFDEPECLPLISGCDQVVAVHGCQGDEQLEKHLRSVVHSKEPSRSSR